MKELENRRTKIRFRVTQVDVEYAGSGSDGTSKI